MPTFEEAIEKHLDARIGTLGRIKTRSLGADVLTLTALGVLVYSQLEGGVKDLASTVIRHINDRRMPFGTVKPTLLRWRNSSELDRLKRSVTFEMVGQPQPFLPFLTERFTLKAIDRRFELNQMGWSAILGIYSGLGLEIKNIEPERAVIDQIVDDRNSAAHYGALPNAAAALFEKQVRANVAVVETVLTDLSIQLLPFFTNGLHKR